MSKLQHQKRFLDCFAACGNILKASRWAKLNRAAHYHWMRGDPAYPALFAEAEARAARVLEDEAVRRAHDGVREAVWHKGKIVGYQLKHSDVLLIFLLKGLKPEKYRERFDHQLTGKDGAPLLPLAAVDAILGKE